MLKVLLMIVQFGLQNKQASRRYDQSPLPDPNIRVLLKHALVTLIRFNYTEHWIYTDSINVVWQM